MAQKTITKSLPCKLTAEDLVAIGKAITDKTLEIERIEDAKKRVQPLRDDITELSHKWHQGTEMRHVACAVAYHQPRTGMKTIIRMDTGDVVETTEMQPEDYQEEIEFGGEDAIDTAHAILDETRLLPPTNLEIPDATIIEDDNEQ